MPRSFKPLLEDEIDTLLPSLSPSLEISLNITIKPQVVLHIELFRLVDREKFALHIGILLYKVVANRHCPFHLSLDSVFTRAFFFVDFFLKFNSLG
ncbi:hypothetical protein TNIN_164041 [Trichonephila inaurata madagascariensis]|uniref:Uncharacterized protein n=1 Tax=Trichonephila inaurata madagascariensis TaxID=2747483 RepID=A0A8X6YIB3_9ARAC|nr:hypothetical protein TNIN_164041 [Trichonephila inaurata madagascariensis]